MIPAPLPAHILRSNVALTPGPRLGPYEVTAGMGQVYRARDTKLARDVALKVLPQTFTAGPDKLARLEHEARVLARFVLSVVWAER